MERVRGIEPLSQPWEGRVLPMNYTRMEPMGGFEPPTFALRKHCSDRLSYIGKFNQTLVFKQIAGAVAIFPAYHCKQVRML
jgi:hypothetical protein